MKVFVCELCESTQFLKKDGVYFCLGCGVRFVTEELRKFMRDLPDGELQIPDLPKVDPARTAVPTPKVFKQPEEAPESVTVPEEPKAAPAPVFVPEEPKAAPAPVFVPEEPKSAPAPTVVSEEPKAAPAPTVLPEEPKAAPAPADTPEEQNEEKAPEKKEKKVEKPVPKKKEKKSAKDEKAKKKNKKGLRLALAIVWTSLIGIIFAGLLYLAIIDEETPMMNIALAVTGAIDLFIAFILYRIVLHIERYNCPMCAAKRVHHRKYLRTTSKLRTFNGSGNSGGSETEEFTHHYKDTYVCPKCGETKVEYISKTGGHITEFDNGKVNDVRKAPKEF